MVRAVRLAALALCATLTLSLATPARAADPDYTTWLFAEGSTSGVLGFEKELLLANPSATPVDVTISVFTQDGEAIAPFGPLTLTPLSRTGINVRSIPGVGDRAGIALRVTATGPIVAERTMYWGGGFFRGGRAWTAPVSDLRGGHNEKGASAGARTWYFAEGEGRFFNTFVSVANPNAAPTRVRARYLDDQGNEFTQSDVIPANGRLTFWPTALLFSRLADGRGGFATIVESVDDAGVGPAQNVIAERQMYWGPGAPFGIRGGHAAMGVTQPSATWYFAEGIQAGLAPGASSFQTFVLLFNPSSTNVPVTVEFFGQGGTRLAQVVRDVRGLARDGVWAREVESAPGSGVYPLRDQAFAVRVTAGAPIVAERAVYWGNLNEGHATAGSTEARRQWGFAEGLQGGFLMYQDANDADKRRFNTFFPIYNPGSAPATVNVHFYTEDGNTGVTKQIVVPGQSRETVWTLLYDELANRKFATFFSSDQPIVVERVVYWGPNNRAGHASVGTPLPDAFPLVGAANAPGTPGAALTVTPNRGVPGGGNTVEIEGTGFGNTELGTQVLFGGKPAQSFDVENTTTIRAVVPPGATGAVDVTVVTRGQTLTQAGGYTYFDPFAAVGAPLNTFDTRVGGACGGNGGRCFFIGSPGTGNALPFEAIVRDVARRDPNALANSCRSFGGSERFMEEVLAELRVRTGSNRWALNIKRGNEGLSEDIVTYYYGPEGTVMLNSTQIFIVDIIGNHCNPLNRFGATPAWIDQTNATLFAGAIGRWTLGNVCKDARYRDAKRSNGEWLFPECRP